MQNTGTSEVNKKHHEKIIVNVPRIVENIGIIKTMKSNKIGELRLKVILKDHVERETPHLQIYLDI